MMPDRPPLVPRSLKIVLALQGVLVAAGMLLTADIYAHKRVEAVAGTNIWGYRGAVARQRQPGEVRLVFVGGSRAFGWGAAASETIPATVRWLIMLQTDAPGRPLRPVVALNLAAVGARASGYAQTLQHFADLRPDFVCIYDDLGLDATPASASRFHAATGYAPALPLVLTEKAMALRFGSVAAGYQAAPPSATSWTGRTLGAALLASGRGLQQLDQMRSPPSPDSHAESLARAVSTARALGARVVVAAGPAVTEIQRHNLEAMRRRLADTDAGHVAVIDLTTVEGLTDPGLTLDGYNYNGAGRVRVAEAIVPVLLAWIERPAA